MLVITSDDLASARAMGDASGARGRESMHAVTVVPLSIGSIDDLASRT